MQSDAELVTAALDGYTEAFGVLVRRYERAACATATAVLCDHHAACDAAQEAFVTAYRKLKTLRKRSAFGAWLLRITRRQAIRMAKSAPKILPLDAQVETPATTEDGRAGEISQQLLAAVIRLPKHERLAVMLKYFDGHQVATIAEMINRPIGTVTKQLSRARERLRGWLSEEGQS